MRLLVLEYKVCTLPYFLDEMKKYELFTILPMLEYAEKQTWEQTRTIAYMVAQSNSAKKLKPTDILKFSWDVEKETKNTKVTKEDVERITRKAKEIEKNGFCNEVALGR